MGAVALDRRGSQIAVRPPHSGKSFHSPCAIRLSRLAIFILATAVFSGLMPTAMTKRRLVVPPRPAVVHRFGRLIQLLSRPQLPLTVTPVAEVPVLIPDSAVPTLQWLPVGTNDGEWQGDLHSVVYLRDNTD